MMPQMQRAAESALAADLRLVDKRHGWRGAPQKLDEKQLAAVLPVWRERLAAAREKPGRGPGVGPGARGPRRDRARLGGQCGRPPAGPGPAPGGRRDLRGAGDGGGGQAGHARPGRRPRRHPLLRRDLGAQVQRLGRNGSAEEDGRRAPPGRHRARARGARALVPARPGPRRQAAAALARAGPSRRGGARGHRSGHPRRARAGGRPRLHPLPVQPGHPGEAAARQRLQALRVGRGHRVRALHRSHGGLRHARPLPRSLHRQGVEAAELREGRLRGPDAAARRAGPLEEHRVGEAHRRARRGRGHRLREPGRHPERAAPEPVLGARHRRGDAARAA